MRTMLAATILILLLLCSTTSWATVNGQCSDCHTMHNSQDGVSVEAELGRSLTRGDCVGCHTGDNTTGGNIPFVNHTSVEYGPDYNGSGVLTNTESTNSLAGGTFSNMGGNDSYGHNVAGISSADAIGLTPPGWIASTFPAAAAGGTATGDINGGGATWATQLTCAGTNGCHGSHTNADDFADVRGAHHGDDTTIDGSTVAQSYRFLRGILGHEDSDWERTVSATDHNAYYGADRTSTATGSMNNQTISYLCAQCHGMFHSNDGTTGGSGIIHGGTGIDNANPWLRHPTDFALSNAGGEYLDYADAGGVTGGDTYNFIAPLATANPTSTVISNPFTNADDDIVTCLSCHRAHGSSYPDALRWDYSAMVAGSGSTDFDNKGCFACHTTKD